MNFDPRPTFPVTTNPNDPEIRSRHGDEDEVEDVQQSGPSYYEQVPPRIFHAQQPSVDVLERVSKETIILVFAAFFIGLLLGKSLTPVILKH